MFTGIISAVGHIESAENRGDLRLTISSPWAKDALIIGESIACNGACLTVVDKGERWFAADLSAETLGCTAPRWNKNDRINLERALKLGDTLGGHMVTGHIDGIATVQNIEISGDSHTLALDAPSELMHFIAEKGSVTLDGVALTVNKVEGGRFWVNIIPHTWEMTTFSERKLGDALNLEIDLIARYVARLLQK